MSVAVITPKLNVRADPTEEDFFTTPDGDDDDEEEVEGVKDEIDESQVKDVVAGFIQKLDGPEVKWTCAACNLEGRDETELRRHIEAVHVVEDKPEFACPVCSKRFKQKKSLSNHMVKHASGELDASGDDGNDKPKVSEREGELSVVWGEGEGDIQRLPRGGFMCLKCNKVFSRRYAANRHLDIAHGTADPSLSRSPCHVCNTVCKNRPALIKHLHRKHNLGAKYARV